MIEKIKITNFKGFKDTFEIVFNKNINIIVGDNEVGKSTILEAINLALTGLYNGRPLYRNLNQYIFNAEAVNEYLASLTTDNVQTPPEITIEIFFDDSDQTASFMGDLHSETEMKREKIGLKYCIKMDEKYSKEYGKFVEYSKEKNSEIKTLPIEYYTIEWMSFSREPLISRSIPIKSSFVDIGLNRYSNGSDIYISRIIKNIFEEEEKIKISQAYRQTKENFISDESIKNANEKLQHITDEDELISISPNLGSTWQDSLITQINSIPFENLGKGRQAMLKTKLSLTNSTSEDAHIILIEEPESHVSHTNLSKQLDYINNQHEDKQIFITTHSSFVSNKLGLSDLFLISRHHSVTNLRSLKPDTQSFFKKIAGYDTLRMILAKRTILVEGDSDELVVQKAYLKEHGKLPIQNGTEVISVGTAFLRFLEISKKLKLDVSVVTDNDGNIDALKRKYSDFKDLENIHIYYDDYIDNRNELEGNKFNFNTLEPLLLKSNSLNKMNEIIGVNYSNEDDLLKYMNKHKTEVALKVFDYTDDFNIPVYISEAVENEK